MNIEILLQEKIVIAIENLFGFTPAKSMVQLQQTRREFVGDMTFVVFPVVRLAKKSPEEIARLLGDYLVLHVAEVETYNVVKGFLNLTVSNGWWLASLVQARENSCFGLKEIGRASCRERM